jgi:hypothetical protein
MRQTKGFAPWSFGRSARIEGRQKLPKKIRHKYTEEETSVYAQRASTRAAVLAHEAIMGRPTVQQHP